MSNQRSGACMWDKETEQKAGQRQEVVRRCMFIPRTLLTQGNTLAIRIKWKVSNELWWNGQYLIARRLIEISWFMGSSMNTFAVKRIRRWMYWQILEVRGLNQALVRWKCGTRLYGLYRLNPIRANIGKHTWTPASHQVIQQRIDGLYSDDGHPKTHCGIGHIDVYAQSIAYT